MPQPRALILRAPGTNCDQETAFAFQRAGGEAQVIHINRLLERPALADEFQVLCLPGGFSYGDDIAAGRIAADQIRHRLVETFLRFRDTDKLVLGICNGFQILLKSGLLLPDAPDGTIPATLTWNDSGRYEDRWVHLSVEGPQCVFLRGFESIYLPIAHAEGKFVAREPEVLKNLAEQGQLVLRYTDPANPHRGASQGLSFPLNPNGSQANVAGVCDATGRVFGLMPHPERFIERTQHPQWTRRPDVREGDGLKVFRNAVEYFDLS